MSGSSESWEEAVEAATVYKCEEKVRVRKAWGAWSQEERAKWIRAVRMLNDNGHYWSFVAVHLYNSDLIHQTALFFAWHRLFMWEFENAIRATAPEHACLTAPVWDWARSESAREDAGVEYTAPWTLYDEFLTDMGGPGLASAHKLPNSKNSDALVLDEKIRETLFRSEWGNCTAHTQNTTGPLPPPFADFEDPTLLCDFPIQFVTCECSTAYPRRPVLRALEWVFGYGQLTLNMDQMASVVVNFTHGRIFHIAYMEAHNFIHGLIGAGCCRDQGSLNSNRSPSDPVFWGHHAVTDYYWDLWMRTQLCPDNRTFWEVADPATDFAAECPNIHVCEICGDKAIPNNKGNTLGLIQSVFPTWDDTVDGPLNFMPFDIAPLDRLIRRELPKPPGVTNKTWYGTWTVREVLSTRYFGGYTYNDSSMPVYDIVMNLRNDRSFDRGADWDQAELLAEQPSQTQTLARPPRSLVVSLSALTFVVGFLLYAKPRRRSRRKTSPDFVFDDQQLERMPLTW